MKEPQMQPHPVPGLYDESEFTRHLREVIDGRWFPGFTHLVQLHTDGGNSAVVAWCDAALNTTRSSLFGSTWETYQAAVRDVRCWVNADPTPVAEPARRLQAGDRVRLHYAARWSDETTIDVLVVSAVDADGDFDVRADDAREWTVLASEQESGMVSVEVQS